MKTPTLSILTNPKTGEQIESRFATTTEAAEFLTTLIQAGEFGNNADFPNKMVAAAARYGESLSPAQSFWIHKLAKGQPKPQATASFNMAGLQALFASAAKHLKRPSIVLALPDGEEVKVSIAGPASRHAGNLMVASPTFGGAYYGRITPEGEFFPGRSNDVVVQGLLTELANDPATVAAKHGHLTGRCCFCNRGLEDARSTEVGYGPVCAGRFGLAWGNKPAAVSIG